MKKSILIVLAAVLVLAGVFCACGETPPTASDSTSSTKDVQTKDTQTKIILYADFSAGCVDAESMDLITSKEQTISDAVTVKALSQGLSEWTGLDFTINNAELSDDSVVVDWSANSTLVAGLDDREQKEEFHFFDVESLNWFMMESLAKTVKENLKICTIYYSMDGGKPLAPKNMVEFKSLPVEQPYEGSAFFYNHADNVGETEELQFTYTDEDNQVTLSYPNTFSTEGIKDKKGNLRFAAQQGDAELVYWVLPNTYEEDAAALIDHIDPEDSEILEENMVVAKNQYLDQEINKEIPCACYWMITTDKVYCAFIECGSFEEASEWYDSLKAGAIYIEGKAGMNVSAEISEDEAMDLLSQVLSDRMTDKTAIVSTGASELDGQHCWNFSFGKNTKGKFTAEEHYAVTDDCNIYVMNITNNQYEPLALG